MVACFDVWLHHATTYSCTHSVHNKESSTQTYTQTRTQTHMHMHTNTHVYTHKCAHTTGADNYITDVTETITTPYTAIHHSTQTPTEH